MKTKLYCKKIVAYCMGLFIMAVGVSVSRVSNLGVSPVNSIPSVLSNITHVDMGICTTAVFVCFILIQIAIMKKEFKIIKLLQIAPSILFGTFVTCSNYICDLFLFEPASYVMALIYLVISVILVAIGILFYLNSEILSLPGEGVMQAISYKANIRISTSKIFFDWTMIVIAVILSLVCLGGLDGIREGTAFAAVGVGICLKFLESAFEKPLRKFIYGDEFISLSGIQNNNNF